jgi:hypothetical protein
MFPPKNPTGIWLPMDINKTPFGKVVDNIRVEDLRVGLRRLSRCGHILLKVSIHASSKVQV